MRLVLAVLVGFSCARVGAQPVAVANRGEAASTSCELPPRLDFEARRYGMLDADDPDFQTWSAWRVGVQFRTIDPPRGTVAMVGDELTWTFDFTGKRTDCALELAFDTHDPFSMAVDLRARTGRIRSVDDEWLLGPPFPAHR